MSTITVEEEMLDRIVQELEAEGYEVYTHPSRILLPAFLENYIPDAVARKRGKNIAVEVLTRSTEATRKLRRVQALFDGQEGWELRVFWASPASTKESVRVQTPMLIKQRISELRTLITLDQLGPSLLLAWATFEALARAILIEEFRRPQNPGRLIQVLAHQGYLTPNEADQLSRLAEKRNRLIHGDLQVQTSRAELERFLRILETLLEMVMPVPDTTS